METTRVARSLRLLSLAAMLVGHAGAQTCYNTWGEEDTNMQPCFAPGTTDTNTTTWCCSRSDYCLSNGLCLSAESNNLMTQQGCTDQNWGGACNKRCPASNSQNSPEIPLIPCPASFDNTTNTIKFCCGPDASSCCATPTSWLTIPTGTIFTTSAAPTSQPKSSTLTIGLGIGLGIGIPILLVLLGVAYLLSQPLHSPNKHKHKHTTKTTTSSDTKTEKSDDTSPTYPPRRKRHHRHRDRHGSFGHVDTNIRPSTDSHDGDGTTRPAFQWPPPPPPAAVLGMGGGRGGHASVAAALARWARSPFGFHNPGVGGGDEVPPSPKEMDGRGRGQHGVRSSNRWRVGEAGAAAELPGASSTTYESGVGFGVGVVGDTSREERGWKGSRMVVVAAEEVELPTPDTPETCVEEGLGKGEGEKRRGSSKGML